MKTTSAVILVVGVVVGLAHAGEPLQTLKEGSWLCTTPEAYDLAIVEQHRPNSDLEGVKERFLGHDESADRRVDLRRHDPENLRVLRHHLRPARDAVTAASRPTRAHSPGLSRFR